MHEAGDLDAAIEAFRAAMVLEPGFASPHISLAGALLDRGRPADVDEAVAVLTGAGPQIDNGICRANGFLIVLDNQDAVSAIPQSLQGIDQDAVIPGVQSDGGFVENIANPGKIGTQLGREANSLGLSAG